MPRIILTEREMEIIQRLRHEENLRREGALDAIGKLRNYYVTEVQSDHAMGMESVRVESILNRLDTLAESYKS